MRRAIKRRLGNQRPAAFPLTSVKLQMLLEGAGLRLVRRIRVLPILRESVVFVAENPDGSEAIRS